MHCLAKKRCYLDLKLQFLISHKHQQREKFKLFDSAPIVSNTHTNPYATQILIFYVRFTAAHIILVLVTLSLSYY